MDVEARIAVEQANAAFYRALESAIIERMEEVWAHEDWIRCVHPGWDLLNGWPRVRESWEMIFQSGQKMRASPSEVSVHIEGDFAWVTCIENITVFNDTSFDSAQAVATNLFIQRAGRWLMVLHHASPIPMIVPDDSSDTIQ
ncbi:MAG TPA: nuclear transport factor 2 family protein [Blastocatellia bacterium]|nr:nuclear transport factor 2 family protein [Blastocatellia bacterium]